MIVLRRQSLWRGLTLLWATGVFWMSTETFSSAHSRHFLWRLFDRFGLSLPAGAADLLNTLIRKGAHFFEYAVLAGLLYRSLDGGGALAWRPAIARLCLLTCGAFAFADELHQAFVAGRGASLLDVAIDIAGGVLAVLSLYLAARGARARRRNQCARPGIYEGIGTGLL